MPPLGAVVRGSTGPVDTGEAGAALNRLFDEVARAETVRQNRQLTSNILDVMAEAGDEGASVQDIMGVVQDFQQQPSQGGIQGFFQGVAQRLGGGTTIPANLAEIAMGDVFARGRRTQDFRSQGLGKIEEFKAQGLGESEIAKAVRIGAGISPRATAITPTHEIAREKLNLMRNLQAKVDSGTATDRDIEDLRKIQIGVSPVQITMGQPASPSERTAIAEGRASIDLLDNLKTLFDSKKTATGPITGRISPFAGLVGLTDDEQESFMAATSTFKNKVIKDITGAQMSEQEAARIMKQVPDITDPKARWLAKWEQTKKNVENIQKRRQEVLRQSGVRVPEGAAPEAGKSLSELEQIEQELAEIERQLGNQ